ncbi:MAG: radical SAM protein [Oligoflexia bacterium]|nr:radical SAM protein [Oligoflexia bacterium]
MELVYCDQQGQVFNHPSYPPVFREGRNFCTLRKNDKLIKMPFGSFLFSLPGRTPIIVDRGRQNYRPLTHVDRKAALAASAFVSSGYLRTYLPAYHKSNPEAPTLSLWGYSGVAYHRQEFYVPAIRIDDDPRSDPAIHENDALLAKKVKKLTALFPQNRLVRQLAYCSTEYRCLCARNFFLNRYEAPIPTAPDCNSRCLGCLSHQDQEQSGFAASQHRLSFKPTPEEIAEVILYHFEHTTTHVYPVKSGGPIASFGQGCEGEPLTRAKDLARAIRLIRNKSDRGTINLNTNGSLPLMVKEMIDAGLDSIRISMNSITPDYYNRYYRPQAYHYSDVLKSIELALNANIFVSLNLFFLPGFTDCEAEVLSLFNFLEAFPISMIQTRNLNIDPDFYLDRIEFNHSPAIGTITLLQKLRSQFPSLRLGQYNPCKESLSK